MSIYASMPYYKLNHQTKIGLTIDLTAVRHAVCYGNNTCHMPCISQELYNILGLFKFTMEVVSLSEQACKKASCRPSPCHDSE